ncbi:response regulator [Postechiella marina]|uniref:Response regulator n=1 Tax=Postechiella marina TaxID=943941 RepID=A0ABP8C2Q9_9FLAO
MLKIILTDDDEDDRLFFKEAIDDISVETELKLFNHGQDLITYLTTPNVALPDLLFLDLNMPIKNGMECLKEIKANKDLQHIIIAIYSTSSSEQDIEDTFVNGANIYIKKPSSFKALKKAVEKVLKVNWQYHTSNFNRDTFLLRI